MTELSAFSQLVPKGFFERYPNMLTLLTTYRCNAQCEQCCFESNPHVKGELSLEDMRNYIDRARREFPALSLVVFTGGECFLLGDDLFDAIGYACSFGLRTRCVTNGYWGKNADRAAATARKLAAAGVNEINISTGLDHQKWVPLRSVVGAVDALLTSSITTLVTVESDTATSTVYNDFVNAPEIRRHRKSPLFSTRCNSWMAFNDRIVERKNTNALSQAESPCDQIFGNVVVTPYRKLSACCGLTLEYIKEVQLGQLDGAGTKLAELYWTQLDDFLKIWIHLDGPVRIIKTLLGEDAVREYGFVHMCEACATMHNEPEIRRELQAQYLKHAPDVLNRFLLKLVVSEAESTSLQALLPAARSAETAFAN